MNKLDINLLKSDSKGVFNGWELISFTINVKILLIYQDRITFKYYIWSKCSQIVLADIEFFIQT